jgi:CDP-diacylglycerol--glycerol-3-phosphate 3-phosphatidyltransferase
MADDNRSWDGRPLDWRNKPTDRFVLRWIKRYLSAPASLLLVRVPGIRPWMATAAAASLGTAAGAIFALGHGWQAGLVAAAGQILDGVDGQLARLTGRSSAAGALLDSVLDRVADAALVLGSAAYLLRTPLPHGPYVPAVAALAFVAVVASNLVSYSGARAAELGLPLPARPTLASKGTRTTAMVLAALATPLWPQAPLAALACVAAHATAAVIYRMAATPSPKSK